jgi:hypothetical protein
MVLAWAMKLKLGIKPNNDYEFFRKTNKNVQSKVKNFNNRRSNKSHLPMRTEDPFRTFINNLTIIIIFLAFVISGFWASQIARSLGIPIDPVPFTAVYFQDPEIVADGIVSGDLIVFGITNGDRLAHKITWRIKSGKTLLKSGIVAIPSNSDKLITEQTTGALSGSKLEIFVGDLETPITVHVVG